MEDQGAAPGGVEASLPLCLTAREGDVGHVEEGQWVGLCVEHPALQGHQLISGEQQVQVPGVGRRERQRDKEVFMI